MSQSPPIYLTELARSGDTKSLDILLNYFLQSIGITARSAMRNGFIELVLEGTTSTPNQKQSEKYLRSFFDYLQIPTVGQVKIFAKNYDTHRLAWWSILEVYFLESIISSPVHNKSEPFCEPVERYSDHSEISLTNALLADQLQIPQPVAFENLPNDLEKSIRRAGLRDGKTRLSNEAQQIYEMMPENVRRGGVDTIRAYRKEHDWSHKTAYADGGSSSPSNGDWENCDINRPRGSRQMTKAEIDNIAKAKAQINFQEGAKIVGSQAAKAGVIAFGVEVAFSGLENFLAVQRGEKTVEQGLEDTLVSSTGAAIVTATIVGGVAALTLAFPPVGAVLGAALTTATPFLQIVGAVGSINRLITILSNSSKVKGIDQLETLMMSYGIDDVELDFRDLEVEDDLLNLKLAMQRMD